MLLLLLLVCGLLCSAVQSNPVPPAPTLVWRLDAGDKTMLVRVSSTIGQTSSGLLSRQASTAS